MTFPDKGFCLSILETTGRSQGRFGAPMSPVDGTLARVLVGALRFRGHVACAGHAGAATPSRPPGWYAVAGNAETRRVAGGSRRKGRILSGCVRRSLSPRRRPFLESTPSRGSPRDFAKTRGDPRPRVWSVFRVTFNLEVATDERNLLTGDSAWFGRKLQMFTGAPSGPLN